MDMSLQSKKSSSRTLIVPPDEVGQYAEQGKKLIILRQDFDRRYVPAGYTKLTLQTPVDTFYALIPQQALFYLDQSNLDGGQSLEEGLDILSALYEEILAASDIFGDGEGINVGGVDLAVTVITSYRTLLSNSLVSRSKKQTSGGDVTAVYNQAEIARLCLEDDYVDVRMRGIAAIATGKTREQIIASDLAEVLGYEKEFQITERLDRDDLRRIATREGYRSRPESSKHMRCTGESYFYLKEDFRNGQDGWDYNLNNMTRTRSEITAEKRAQIGALENEIHAYQREHTPDGLSPHDISRTRQFMNIKYGAGLNVDPKRQVIE